MKNTKQNLLVGSEVVIDWPITWRGCPADKQGYMRQQASLERPKFGQTGTIVATYPADESGNSIDIRLDGDGSIYSTIKHAVTITKAPPADQTDDLLREIVALLKNIDLKT